MYSHLAYAAISPDDLQANPPPASGQLHAPVFGTLAVCPFRSRDGVSASACNILKPDADGIDGRALRDAEAPAVASTASEEARPTVVLWDQRGAGRPCLPDPP